MSKPFSQTDEMKQWSTKLVVLDIGMVLTNGKTVVFQIDHMIDMLF